jgi:hypothetical protein
MLNQLRKGIKRVWPENPAFSSMIFPLYKTPFKVDLELPPGIEAQIFFSA